MEIKEILLSLLCSEVLGGAAAESVAASLDADRAAMVLHVAKKHDLAHIVAAALIRSGIFAESAQAAKDEAERQKFAVLRKKCEHAQMVALYRYESLQYALDEIGRTLSEAKIAYMPLKGSVIRAFYPVPWHRSSCDIDILVHESDLEHACEALQSRAGYRVEGQKNFHDIHLYSPAGIHLELHFSILSGDQKYDAVLSRVWENCFENANISCRFEQTKAFFLFHHVAHMAHHFSSGGCGIKPFIDLFVIEKYMGLDKGGAAPLLAEAGLETFYEKAMALMAAWFLDGAHTPLTQRMEDYLLLGGVYGTVDNKVLVHQSKRGGKLRYALSRIFLSRRSLSRIYPVLERFPWLLPVMQVRRWFRLLFSEGLRRGVHEMKVNGALTKDEAEAASRFMADIGL